MRSLAILFFFIILLGCSPKQSTVCFGKQCFLVEIADSAEEHQQGLMFREHLDANKGMLFIFDHADMYSFWMKNTKIPLDMLWLDENKTVVFIAKKVQPCTQDPCPVVTPDSAARYILETNAGLAEQFGIQKRTSAVFNLS